MEAARLLACGDLESEDAHARQEAHVNEQLARFGLQAEGPVLEDLQPFYLWPENLESYHLFLQLQTQWRHGFHGHTGLDYTAVIEHMRAMHVPRRKFRRLYEDVRIMEAGALQGFDERRRRQEGQQ